MNADETDEGDNGSGTAASGPDSVREAIMEATYRALCEHGAADLTVQAIGDEFAKSKSLIFYHYDSKEDLLSSFLAYLLDGFEQRVAASEVENPRDELDDLIDALLFGPKDNESFQTAIFELRSQAPFNEAYREQFQTNHTYVHDLFEATIEHGIEDGVFIEADASRIATMLLTIIDGARTQLVVLGDDTILDTTRTEIDDRLETTLFVEGSSE